jgi:hypothetical protein
MAKSFQKYFPELKYFQKLKILPKAKKIKGIAIRMGAS